MCGIAGFIFAADDDRDNRAVLQAMCNTIKHRGPDDEGMMLMDHVALGMRRLSIIDLQTGHQPVHNEDETIWVILNGEIYNYVAIRQDLVTKGHKFYTATDTEVLVHLYEEYGEDCVQHLRGMFAFAIWDRKTSTLVIARDRMGEKPLYYYADGSSMVFASELKAILCHPQVKQVLNIKALLGYLEFNYIPEPLSIFECIHRLLPGHLLVFRRGRMAIKQYWDIPRTENTNLTEGGYQDELMNRLQEAVRIQLVSDVPLGAFLSGGIDSSTIVALMARAMDRPVKTFSIGFEDAKFDERSYARAVAHHLGTEHHELVVKPASISLLDTVISHFDEPFGDPSAIPTYHVAKLASDHVKVVLSGDGGDEIFAGYDRYQVALGRQKIGRIPVPVAYVLGGLSRVLPKGTPGKRWLHNHTLSPHDQYLDSITYLPKWERASLLNADLLSQLGAVSGWDARSLVGCWFQPESCGDLLSRLLYLDSKSYLPGDILTKVDRMAMAHSLEVRAPFLDHTLVEYMAKMPSSMKIREGQTKYILKRLGSHLLPAEILNRPKQGFAVPFSYWFKGEMKWYLRDVLSDRQAIGRGFFNQAAVETMLTSHENGNHRAGSVLWMLLVFELWCRSYLK